jgi:hypothetical protein
MTKKNTITTKTEYGTILCPNKISVEGSVVDIASDRLEKILDIRKFEIDLYWKRATYFWTFIAATLTGYGLTATAKEANHENLIMFQFLIVCFGLVFSFAWFMVNKGSKFWQENWEKHLDMTEDSVIGPLYKTTISKEDYSSFWNPTSAYAASVSKINQILSFFVFTIWLGILVNLFVSGILILSFRCDFYFTSIGVLTLSAIIYLIFGTRTSLEDTIVHFDIRGVMDKKQ